MQKYDNGSIIQILFGAMLTDITLHAFQDVYASGTTTFYLPQPDFCPWSVFRAAGSWGWGQNMWGPCRSNRLLSRPACTHQERETLIWSVSQCNILEKLYHICTSATFRNNESINVLCHASVLIFHDVRLVFNLSLWSSAVKGLSDQLIFSSVFCLISPRIKFLTGFHHIIYLNCKLLGLLMDLYH